MCPNTYILKLRSNILRILQMTLSYRNHLCLYWCKPGRERTAMVFYKHPHKPFHRTQQSAVYHVRPVLVSIFTYVA